MIEGLDKVLEGWRYPARHELRRALEQVLGGQDAAVRLVGHVQAGTLSLGDLLLVMAYLGRLYEPLRTENCDLRLHLETGRVAAPTGPGSGGSAEAFDFSIGGAAFGRSETHG